MTTSFDGALELLGRVVPSTAGLVEGVAADQWARPTPCQEMTVLHLVEHLVGGLSQFAAVAEGLPLDPTAEPTLEPADAPAAFAEAAEHMLATWSGPGVIETVYPMPWGDTPGEMLVGFMVIEEVTHGWDLARATGQALPFDDDVAEATLELARSYDDQTIRVPGMFGPEVAVAAAAPPMDRLAGFLGRQPRDTTSG